MISPSSGGGLIGVAISRGNGTAVTISKCYSTGNISVTNYTGGFIGIV